MLPGADELWADLDPSVRHCNHGSYGAVTRPVREHRMALQLQAETNPNQWFRFELPERLEAARRHMAAFVGVAPDNAVFVANATSGVNVALNAVRLHDGDEVIVTDHVYGAVLRTARRATDRVNGSTRIAAIDLLDDIDAHVDAFVSLANEKTRVAIVDHIASPTGLVLPVTEIVGALRARGVVTIVDAAHAPGSRRLNVADIGADFWTGNFHKWAAAPRPCAALAVSDEWRDRTQPLVASFGLEDGFPNSFSWQGTDDYTAYLCLEPAVDILESLGWDALWHHNDELAAYGAQVVADRLGTEPALPTAARGPMSLVALPDGLVTDDASARALIARVSQELSVEVAVNPWRGGGYLRMSAHAYNDASDFDTLAKGLPDLLAG
ncbi:MAG: isopenicillin-N epimerase [Actinomycetota bacterium]